MRIRFALAFSASTSASTSYFLLSVSLSASRPASRELALVRFGCSRRTGSLLRLVEDGFGFGFVLGFGSGATFLACTAMSVSNALLAAMFSCRFLSNALIGASAFTAGIVTVVVE